MQISHKIQCFLYKISKYYQKYFLRLILIKKKMVLLYIILQLAIVDIIYLLFMDKQRQQYSRVQPYRYHQSLPFEKSIYLSKEGQEIQHPFSHKPTQARISKSSVNPLQNLARSNTFSKEKRLTISRINTKKQSSSFWDLFSCCKDETNVQSNDYDDCYVCNRRVFHKEQTNQSVEQEEETPYTSVYRLKSRQQKPIQVFYDKLKNHELAGQSILFFHGGSIFHESAFYMFKVIFLPYKLMKTTRTNSFRLHRINKTGSVRKSSQTFYDPDESFKLAALNSVTRGVKHADLSFLTGNDLNKLRVEPLESNDGEYHSAHHNLTEVRKKYDDMKKERVFLQQKIVKEKEQIQKLNIFKTEYEDKIGEAKSRAAILKDQLQAKKSLLDITSTEKKVLLNIESRHKTDKVFYDQRKFDFQKELSYLAKQLNIFKKEGLEIGESQDRTVKVYEKLSKQLDSERQERQAHIKNIEDMIEQKLQLLNLNQAREADLYEIAERAIQDKDMNQKNWRNIFLTHIFVNKMLRNKIEKEMEKFKIVEFAFKEIKTATGVNDAKNLVHKYLNKEAVYGELLGKIADNEKTIEHLKNETEELIQEFKNLQMELEVLQSIKIKSQDLHDNIKELQQYDEKATVAEEFQNKMGQWTARQLKKLSAIDKKHEEVELPKGTDKLKEVILKYLSILKTESESVQEIDYSHQTDGLGSKENEKIVRIIPKKSRLNSSGEEIYDVQEEQTNPSSQNEEIDLINNQREELLRTNEKFMKDLKKKKQEERKLFLEKNQPKKEKAAPKAPEAKKEE